ncbi:hypothetical protein LTR08_001236 [Meristemomyces frigidus]|nr:hypothetical protein LTR08_001236 [Meristemomyces frigidus]
MNNNEFRKLVYDTPARQPNPSTNDGGSSATPAAFGAKKSSFMPMTPRAVKGGIDVDFARQVRERNAALRPTKKFKSSAPKGVKYGAGYTDRAKAREEEGDGEGEGSKAARIKALEEQMKLGQIPVETFEALRDRITGGEAENSHLVKGLDRQLLERVRRGEDVLGTSGGDDKAGVPDVDEELDKLAEREVEGVKREKVEKRGVMAPPTIAGVKRSRDQIMAELKAQRQAATEAKKNAILDGRWRKVGEKEKSRVEFDPKGREVLITVDEDGMVKRKVRKVAVSRADEELAQLDMPDASKPVLGADTAVPAQAPQAVAAEEEDDDDIFEGVGTEYNPLGNVADDDDDSDEDESTEPAEIAPPTATKASTPPEDDDESGSEDGEAAESEKVDQPIADSVRVPASQPALAKRSYFAPTSTTTAEVPVSDRFAGIENVLKKAANLDASRAADDNVSDGDSDEEGKAARVARRQKRAAMVAGRDRDLEDMDMGFGSSRFEDEEDGGGEEGGQKVKLSEWKGGGAVWDADEKGKEKGGNGGERKKRKPKRRKGDVNSAADVMRVIEGRKGK